MLPSEQGHSMFLCESLQGEHFSHPWFTPSAPPPPRVGQANSTLITPPLCPLIRRTSNTPTGLPLSPSEPVDSFLSAGSHPFSQNCYLLSTGAVLGGWVEKGKRVGSWLLGAALRTSQQGSEPLPTSLLGVGRVQGLPLWGIQSHSKPAFQLC